MLSCAVPLAVSRVVPRLSPVGQPPAAVPPPTPAPAGAASPFPFFRPPAPSDGLEPLVLVGAALGEHEGVVGERGGDGAAGVEEAVVAPSLCSAEAAGAAEAGGPGLALKGANAQGLYENVLESLRSPRGYVPGWL